MKKLSNQLSFEALLEDDVPLKPHIVMWGDPRWDSALADATMTGRVLARLVDDGVIRL